MKVGKSNTKSKKKGERQMKKYIKNKCNENQVKENKCFNYNNGITLVALVVTIVVLLILAGVSINLVIGQNGLISRAKEAAQKTKNATESEMQGMDDLATQIAALSNTQSVFEGGNWNSTLGICTPKLGNNMVGVYWSDGSKNDNGTYKASLTSTEKEVTSDQAEFSWNDWYNYRAETTEKLDSKQSRWANAKSTVDGSYFVWIPRYEYKILSGEHTSTAGKIDVQFINTSTVTPTKDGYKVHPAFTTNLALGGWDKELSGIWIAKYEMSMEQTTDNGATWNNVKASPGTGYKVTSQTVRMVSKPSYYSVNYISINNCFKNSINYSAEQNTGVNSHLIKNSEWGAATYLTHSKYGRNGNEVSVNNFCSDSTSYARMTGFSTGGKQDGITNELGGKENLYNGKNGLDSSTTGNLYGIYDMNGGNWEYTSTMITQYGISSGDMLYKELQYSLTGNIISKVPENSDSNKLITVYPITLQESKNIKILEQYKNWNIMYGDAIYETSANVPDIYGAWNGDSADSVDQDGQLRTFLARGGGWANRSSGIFAFIASDGFAHNDIGYRLVLITE